MDATTYSWFKYVVAKEDLILAKLDRLLTKSHNDDEIVKLTAHVLQMSDHLKQAVDTAEKGTPQ